MKLDNMAEWLKMHIYCVHNYFRSTPWDNLMISYCFLCTDLLSDLSNTSNIYYISYTVDTLLKDRTLIGLFE